MRLNIVVIVIPLFFSYLSSSAQFKEGFIIDKYGQRFPGLINFVQGETLFYKADKKSKKEELTVNDLQAFLVERDSFITIKNFKVSAKKTVSGFARVLIKQPDKLLCSISSYTQTKSTAMIATWEATHYLIQSQAKFYVLNKGNFMKEVPMIVEDDQALKQKILSRELQFDDMEKIISMYSK